MTAPIISPTAILLGREGKTEAVEPALQQALALDENSVAVHLAFASFHATRAPWKADAAQFLASLGGTPMVGGSIAGDAKAILERAQRAGLPEPLAEAAAKLLRDNENN